MMFGNLVLMFLELQCVSKLCQSSSIIIYLFNGMDGTSSEGEEMKNKGEAVHKQFHGENMTWYLMALCSSHPRPVSP